MPKEIKKLSSSLGSKVVLLPCPFCGKAPKASWRKVCGGYKTRAVYCNSARCSVYTEVTVVGLPKMKDAEARVEAARRWNERSSLRNKTEVSLPQASERNSERSATTIVDQTNQLARTLYALRGYVVCEGYRFDRAHHPHEVEAWRGACFAQLILTATDPEDALLEMDEE